MQAPPLHPAWLDAIDAVARRVLRHDDRRGEALADEIRRLSLRYTRRGGDLRLSSSELSARLRFFLPRDLPKIGGPLAELALAGALPPGPVWRVLDVGAGLGATSLGTAAFAHALGGIERLEVLASDHDARALDVLGALAAAAGHGSLAAASVPVELRTRAIDLETDVGTLPPGPFDLVVLGLVLNELFVDRPAVDALAARERVVRALLTRLGPAGALVILEPALAETSRGLMALRDRLVAPLDASAEAGPAVHVVAPCVDRAPCPLLGRERDWCHEDLPLVLAPPLREIARSAGLRWEGASYSYLALCARERSLAAALGAQRPARVVGGPIVQKGHRELQLCRGGEVLRLNVLDRDPDRSLDVAARGSVLELDRDPPPAGRGMLRHGRDVGVRVLRALERPP